MSALEKTIKIKFVDFWDSFIPEESLFYEVLSKKYNIVFSDSPDYIIFSVHGNEHLKYDCVKIFYTLEDQTPDFNIADYAIGFANIVFEDRYFRLPSFYLDKDDCLLMESKHFFTHEDFTKKTGFCSFVYSNTRASNDRVNILEALSSYKKVDSGGRLRNNIGGKPVVDKLEFQTCHKFSIACENYRSNGYTTEKLIQSFAAKTIPIYCGDYSIKDTFNEDSFINVADYSSLEDVINEIKRIDSDDSVFLNILRTPALRFPERDGYQAKIEQFSVFLYSIFDRPIEKAVRHSRGFWQQVYLNQLIKREKAFSWSIYYKLDRFYLKNIWRNRDKKIAGTIYRIVSGITGHSNI